MKRGLYRIRGAGDRPDDIRVEADGIELPMEEPLYRARGYLPSVDDLPWQEEYLHREQSADGSGGTREATEKATREKARQEFLARFRRP